MMIYFSIILPAQLDRPRQSNRAPHRLNLLKFTSCVVCMCFWLVVVFELPVGGHIRQRHFFSIFFISFSSPPGTKRHPPTHASTMPPLMPHHRKQHRRRRRRAPAGIGKLPNRPPPRLPPRPTAEPTPPMFPPRQGASRHKRTLTRAGCAPMHPSPASRCRWVAISILPRMTARPDAAPAKADMVHCFQQSMRECIK
jgi:hypothetical protein